MTVKTAALYKKLYFFSLKVLKVRKRTWNFVLLCQSRNKVGQFNVFLHRPIKILQFLTPVRVQKCLT